MFLVNMLETDKILESVDDITAADTAPNPTNDTAGGVRYCMTSGNISAALPSVAGSVAFSRLM